jgi:uncharacterized protein YcbK (DUF882 family)
VRNDKPGCDRRQALSLIGGTLCSGVALAPGLARALEPALPSRALTLHNTHTLESLSIEFCRAGDYLPAALAAIDHVLRDHRTNDVHPIDPKLLDLLHALAVRGGREPEFEVISGYRSARTNALLHERSSGVAAHSLHMEGRAIDIRLVGLDVALTRDLGLELARGGVGYYRASQFVHLDTGRLRAWSG